MNIECDAYLSSTHGKVMFTELKNSVCPAFRYFSSRDSDFFNLWLLLVVLIQAHGTTDDTIYVLTSYVFDMGRVLIILILLYFVKYT